MKDLVSIIMPVFNGGAFIAESIQSVLQQTHSRLELLIINDGSTDNTEVVVRGFLTDERIRYVVQDNRGVSAARNAGLNLMKGDFFCFLDCDDCLTRDSLENRLKIFEKSDETAFVDGAVEVYNKSMTHMIRKREANYRGDPFRALLNVREGCFFGPTWLIRRDPSFQFQFRAGMTHAEDLLFFFQIAHLGMFDYTNSCILRYRSHGESAMGNIDGLIKGYSQLRQIVSHEFRKRMSLLDQIIWALRIRKLGGLSLVGFGKYGRAITYFIFG